MDSKRFPPWAELKTKLSPVVVDAVSSLGFQGAAPVQERTIPLLLSGSDVVVEAVTGSGKTLAYLLPSFEMLLIARAKAAKAKEDIPEHAIFSVVVLPSRELALQVREVADKMAKAIVTATVKAAEQPVPVVQTGKKKKKKSAADIPAALGGISVQCFVGGHDASKDVAAFQQRGGHILVGTPGRLYELLVQSKQATLFGVRHVEMLILDEADRLLELGFRGQLDAILKRLPKQRRTGLFSATQTQELSDLARAGMRNPLCVSVRSAGAVGADKTKPQVPERLSNFVAIQPASGRLDRLMAWLEHAEREKVIVYVASCAAVEWLALALNVLLPHRKVIALHGQLPMRQRQRAHAAIAKAATAVLVCTDVAARGLDIPDIANVVQFDAPVAPRSFIHRIGRTARMGREGTSLLLLTPAETEYVQFMKQQNVLLQPFGAEDIDEAAAAAPRVPKERTLGSALEQRSKEKSQKGKGAVKAQRDKAKGQKFGMPDRVVVRGAPCVSESIAKLRRAAMGHAKDLTSLGLRAFVTFLRAYKEHECRYIFQLKNLDVVDLIHSFALFSVPNCGEIRRMGRIVLPLEPEFREWAMKLKQERIEAEKEKGKKNEKRPREEAGSDGDISCGSRSTDISDIDSDEDAAGVVQTELARSFRNKRKEQLKQMQLSHGERRRAWRRAEEDDLLRDSYLVKLEKQGKLKGRRVDELMGNDAIENALMSTRERRDTRRHAKK